MSYNMIYNNLMQKKFLKTFDKKTNKQEYKS